MALEELTESNLPSKDCHSHNLSINSITSIIEPTTPPSIVNTSSRLWDTSKPHCQPHLPNFSLDLPSREPAGHKHNLSLDSFASDKENLNPGSPSLENDIKAPHSNSIRVPNKIDKEYLASLNKSSLLQLRPYILRLAKDQHGCRFLQKQIDEASCSKQQCVANFEIIFKEVYSLLYELIIDPFGNYLIQKLVDYCSEDDLNLVLEILQHNLFLISINQHGTRALQKIIEFMNNSFQFSLLVKRLKPYIIDLIKDLNGNHVIQKILHKYSPENCQFIYDSIIDEILVVATHKHGCCVLQKCLNHVNSNQMTAFSNKILQYNVYLHLINDQFGNYVLQYLISINSIDVNLKLFDNFMKYGLSDLCNLKFSSNVVEKLLKSCFGNETKGIEFSDLKFTIIHAILSLDFNKMINDPYGNYVIQTLIDILVNPCVSYVVESGPSKVILLPSLQQLLPTNLGQSMDSMQIQIIKTWFHNCKIVSSFGKRIQLKINTILNGAMKNTPRKMHLRTHQNNNYMNLANRSNQNMNANGEFVFSESIPNYRLHAPFKAPNLEMSNKNLYVIGAVDSSNFCRSGLFNTNYWSGVPTALLSRLGISHSGFTEPPTSAYMAYSTRPPRFKNATGEVMTDMLPHQLSTNNPTMPYLKDTYPGQVFQNHGPQTINSGILEHEGMNRYENGPSSRMSISPFPGKDSSGLKPNFLTFVPDDNLTAGSTLNEQAFSGSQQIGSIYVNSKRQPYLKS